MTAPGLDSPSVSRGTEDVAPGPTRGSPRGPRSQHGVLSVLPRRLRGRRVPRGGRLPARGQRPRCRPHCGRRAPVCAVLRRAPGHSRGRAAVVPLSEAWPWASLRGRLSRDQKQSRLGPAAGGASSLGVPWWGGTAWASRASPRPRCGTRGCPPEEGRAGPDLPCGAVLRPPGAGPFPTARVSVPGPLLAGWSVRRAGPGRGTRSVPGPAAGVGR